MEVGRRSWECQRHKCMSLFPGPADRSQAAEADFGTGEFPLGRAGSGGLDSGSDYPTLWLETCSKSLSSPGGLQPVQLLLPFQPWQALTYNRPGTHTPHLPRSPHWPPGAFFPPQCLAAPNRTSSESAEGTGLLFAVNPWHKF